MLCIQNLVVAFDVRFLSFSISLSLSLCSPSLSIVMQTLTNVPQTLTDVLRSAPTFRAASSAPATMATPSRPMAEAVTVRQVGQPGEGLGRAWDRRVIKWLISVNSP